MIRCVVFDFDGTLVDSNEVKRQAFFEVAREHDPEGDVVRAILDGPTPGDRYAVTRAMARAFAPDDGEDRIRHLAEELVGAYREITDRNVVACREVEGATTALDSLVEREIPVYINTATPLSATESILEARGLARFFCGVLGGESSKLDNLRTIAALVGTKPNEMVLVGDGEDDRSAARDFQCAFVGVETNAGRFATRPEICLRDLEHLPDVLTAIEGDSP